MCWQVIDQDINQVVTDSGYCRSKGVDQHVNGVSTNSRPTVDQYVDRVTVDSSPRDTLNTHGHLVILLSIVIDGADQAGVWRLP